MQPQFELPPFLSSDDDMTLMTYNQVFYRIERMATSNVEWKQLPDEINPMVLNRYLFYRGACVFFYDDILEKYLVLPMTAAYAWDENGIPTEYEVTGFKGYRKRLSIEDSVLIFNNMQLQPDATMCGLFAQRITNTLRLSDMRLEAHKIGKIITTTENKRRSYETLIQKVKRFQLFILGSPAITQGIKDSTVLDVDNEYIVDRLDSHYQFLFHDAMAYFGIDSVSDKQSGVNIAETKAESSIALANQAAIMTLRKQAADKINEMFGLDIEPVFIGERGSDYGELYNDAQNGTGSSDGQDATGGLS